MTKNILTEAVIVGVSLVIVGMVLHLIASKMKHHDMNNNVTLALHFFVAGFCVHLLAEYTGVNRWYCAHGNACLKK